MIVMAHKLNISERGKESIHVVTVRNGRDL